ncbi:MAG TPA: response regulator [Salinimicrobium sp.]|nr:response regulator [Salinimicrobium sp.]
MEILIVDDDNIVCMLHRNQLLRSQVPYKLVTCSNGKQAFEYIRSKKEEVNSFLVLLDINMPVMNGWEFLEKFKEKSLDTDIYVVLVSSSTYRDDKQKAFRSDKVIDYVTKPLGVSDVEKIKNLKEIKSYFN